jgi:hypothetical protein
MTHMVMEEVGIRRKAQQNYKLRIDLTFHEKRNIMDQEKDIEKAAEKLMKDNGLSKLQALSMLLGRYQSKRRLEKL